MASLILRQSGIVCLPLPGRLDLPDPDLAKRVSGLSIRNELTTVHHIDLHYKERVYRTADESMDIERDCEVVDNERVVLYDGTLATDGYNRQLQCAAGYRASQCSSTALCNSSTTPTMRDFLSV